MAEGVTGSSDSRQLSLEAQLIVALPGSGMADSAIRAAEELARAGRRVAVITNNSLLITHLRGLLGAASSDIEVCQFGYFFKKLWGQLFHTRPPRVSEREFDFEKCLNLALQWTSPLRVNRHVVVVDGCQLPRDFYLLLRVLDIPLTVYAGSDLGPGASAASVREIRTALGNPKPIPLATNLRNTTAVARLAAHFRELAGGRAPALPQREGPRPALWHDADISETARRLARYSEEHSAESIGVLLHKIADVDAFYGQLKALGAPVQFQHSKSYQRPDGRIDLSKPGLKVTTWASARGIEFDTVVLPELQDVTLAPTSSVLAGCLEYLVTRSRRAVVLAYSGSGVPTLVRQLPPDLLDDQQEQVLVPAPVQPSIHTEDEGDLPGVQDEVELLDEQDEIEAFEEEVNEEEDDELAAEKELDTAELTTVDHQSLDVSDAVAAARRVLAKDRFRYRPDRYILSALEEIGLAVLMRPDGPLDMELAKDFRARLDPADERARAFDALVVHNQRLVHSVATHYAGQGIEPEDLTQIGMLGLIRAVQKFDATKGYKFSTYATWWIRQAMGRGVADQGRLVRLPVHMVERINKVRRARAELRVSMNGELIPALAEKTGYSESQVRDCLLLMERPTVSLDSPAGDDGSTTLGELLDIPTPDNQVDLVLDRRWVAEIVAREIDSVLNNREARIVRLRFGLDDDDPQTLQQVGQKFGVTRERIRQLEKQALRRLKEGLRLALGLGGAPEPVAKKRTRKTQTVPQQRVAKGGEAVIPPTVGWVEALERIVRARVDAGARALSVIGDLEGPRPWYAVIDDCAVTEADALIDHVAAESGSLQDGPSPLDEKAGLTHLALGTAMGVIFWTRTNDNIPRCTSVVIAPHRGKWWIKRGSASTSIWFPDSQLPTNGSALVAFDLRRLPGQQFDQARLLEELRELLGLVHAPLLARNRLRLRLLGQSVRSRDPFLVDHLRGQDLGTEVVRADGLSARVTPYVLPHPEALSEEDVWHAGDPLAWQESQGIYLIAGDRYRYTGGWLDLPGLRLDDDTALARLKIIIDRSQLDAWCDPVSGQPCSVPEPLQERVIALGKMARRRSAEVIHHHRTPVLAASQNGRS